VSGADVATPLAGKVALVTGASRGIGAATAKALAAAGAHVVLVARTAAELESVEDDIFQAGGNATIAPVDLAEPDGVARLASAISERWVALDILVINAAVLPALTPVWQIEPRDFSRAITLNVLATHSLITAFHPLLKGSQDARVIGLTSSVGAAPRLLGGLWRHQGRVRQPACQLCPGSRRDFGHSRGHRRSRRHPHQDARQGLSGRKPRQREGARRGGSANHGPRRRGLRQPASRTGG
jgi:NAD(P)-dependent dehydrogenase (short-subunit alcohol dehydrogenase family)